MPKFINTLSLVAGLIALLMGIWNDWGFLVVVKRVVISYLAFFSLASVMALAVRSVTLLEPEPPVEPPVERKKNRKSKQVLKGSTVDSQ